MNIWHCISPDRIKADKFMAVIEIPKGSKKKYELDKETGLLRLDRILYTSTHYPANYGFIPLTFADDGDPLDVLVLCSEPLESMTLVECIPIGIIEMTDESFVDEKIIALPTKDPSWNCFTDISELPLHIFEEIKHFFEVYKNLEGKITNVNEILGSDRAKLVIQEAIHRYKAKFNR